MRTHGRRELRHAALLALLALGVTALLIETRAEGAGRSALNVAASAWQGLVGEVRPPVSVGQRMIIVLKAPSLGDRVGRAGGRAGDSDERRWTAAALASQNQLLAELAREGVSIEPEFRFARVLNGFSAALDPRAVALLEHSKEVAGVYPVRVAYPATIGSGTAPAASGIGALPGFDGRGVTVALLDTGVEARYPPLLGHVLDEANVIGQGSGTGARARPDDAGRVERHGTEMAGLLVGSAGIAPGASILPIRVAGWQRDATGRWAVYARTDQLLAGLERAVDPNGDGIAHDAARVALVPLAEPYAAFAESPEARAVAGATQLDMVVVTAAGNDGPAGPAYGSISGPGGAPAALTAGAVDSRPTTVGVRVVLRTGLRIQLNRVLSLAGGPAPSRPLDLELAGAALRRSPAGSRNHGFFDARGFSLVAGRAALALDSSDPASTVADAVRAGAAAVVLAGARIPPGGLGLGDRASIPVVTIEHPEGLLAALRRGITGVITIGAPRRTGNAGAGRLAAFSSRGLAFDGRVKPELVAPGVGLETVEPGAAGSLRPATVNGSSAAAALVAGCAALLVQARPDLDAAALKSLLANSARRLGDQGIAEEGAGLVDLGAAAAAETAVAPITLALGRASKLRWRQRRVLTIRNVSTRAVTVTLTNAPDDAAATAVAFSISRSKVTIRRGSATQVALTATLLRLPRAPIATGTIEIRGKGGNGLHVPWSLSFGSGQRDLVGVPHLSERRFRPSDTKPAVLFLRLGRVLRSTVGPVVRPVARLDVQLWNAAGKNLGSVARLRDLLPGRYALGLTGRDPAGAKLDRGRYRLKLVAIPTGGGIPSRRSIGFTIS